MPDNPRGGIPSRQPASSLWVKRVDKWGKVGHSGDLWPLGGGTAPSKGGTDSDDERKRAEVFLGEYFHSLDGKGRVVMPSGFRRRLEEGCVITKGQDGQLVIWAADDFEKKASEVIDRPQDKGGRRFSRTLFAAADLQTPDKSGRVLVKPELRNFARLEPGNEIAVLGLFDHIELWDKDRHLADRASSDEMYLDEED
jgi:MraZ protein